MLMACWHEKPGIPKPLHWPSFPGISRFQEQRGWYIDSWMKWPPCSIFKHIFMELPLILIQIKRFIPECPPDNKAALVQLMACHQNKGFIDQIAFSGPTWPMSRYENAYMLVAFSWVTSVWQKGPATQHFDVAFAYSMKKLLNKQLIT